MKIIWQEFKLLDKSTNFSSRTEIIKEITKRNIDIKYYCSYKDRKLYYGLHENTIHYFEISRLRWIRSIIFLLKLFVFNIYLSSSLRPNIVILDIVTLFVAWPGVLFSKILRTNIKYILDIRTIPVKPETFKTKFILFRLGFRISCKLCDGISFITPFMRNFLLMNGKLSKLPTIIWSSGFNELLFRPKKRTNNSKDLILFYHGGLSISRGILELIKATKLLKEHGFPVRLKLIGNIVEKEQLYGFIHQNKMEDYCTISPAVEIAKVPRLISECVLPVIPLPRFIGWRVSSPLKLMEYLAMQKCVVVTDIEAHRDVMGSMPFAFYAKSEKAEDLKKAIQFAYKNRHKFNQYGKLARKFVLRNYTWGLQAKKLISFLKRINNE